MASKRIFYAEIVPLKVGGAKRAVYTYHSQLPLKKGQLVTVVIGKLSSVGIVTALTIKPAFATKEVGRVSEYILPVQLIELAKWMANYYATPLARVFATVLPAQPTSKIRKPLPTHTIKAKALPIKLQPQQAAAIKKITHSKKHSFLLHGITGSGKTQVYIELIKQNLKLGKSAIVLVPEIALTPQLTEQLEANFGNSVIVTHSRLTPSQRRNLWQQISTSSQPLVVLGPRSALFAPLKNLGIIVIDEAHETTYKQEQAPRYQAASVAAKLAHITGAKLVLGTATPSAADYFLAQNKHLMLVELPERVYKKREQVSKVVDLREKTLLKNSSTISSPLLDLLQKTLSRGKQSLLFMNRRGSARMALCTHCSWVATCPNCGIPLTFHADTGTLLCHWCNYKTAPPARCPECEDMEIRFIGSGTKRIESEIKRLLPDARIARLDKDSFDTTTVNSIYQQLIAGKIDILIGTQMIAKGLDIANIETIGVVLADTMLYLPDYTAAERTYQLLHQVSGRAGRRQGSSAHVLIQTYSPDHPAIQLALKEGYKDFMTEELEERKLLNYPPYVYLLKLTITKATRINAQQAAEELAAVLRKHAGLRVAGPSPSWQETLRGKFTWQIIVKSKQRSKLVEISEKLPAGWTHDLDPINLL